MSLLASLQLVLYAGLWLIAQAVHPEERPALRHWLGFSLAAAAQAALVAWRPAGPPWLTHSGSSLATVLSLVLAGRGVLCFLRVKPRDGLLLGLLGLAIGALAWIGPHNTHHRMAAASFFNAVILVSTFTQARAPFVAEFGRRMAGLATLPVLVLLGLSVYFVGFGLTGRTVDITGSSTVSVSTWVVTLVTAGLFNFLFVFLVTLRLLQRLRGQASRDALTGLPNRRAMQERLQLEWERARRYDLPLTAIGVDIDHFKQINDRYGHEAGDLALQQVAQALQAHVRETDHLSRIGGEEFLILMPQGRAASDGMLLAERLRSAVAQTVLQWPQGESVALTASFGVGERQAQDVDGHDLLRRADQALYQAKHQGRNRVVLQSPPAPSPCPVSQAPRTSLP